MKVDLISLPVNTPGTVRSLQVRRYGREGARPKVYVQAGIHADELPANLAAHHLAGLLDEADGADSVIGEIVLVPVANPIGLSNIMFGDHLGRFHAQSGQNFNRGWPNVAQAVSERARDRLGPDAEANLALVRHAVLEELERVVPGNEAEALRLMLMKRAADADIVLDLHTDAEAELHIYLDEVHWPEAADLAGLLGAAVVMFARNSGNGPFEETVAVPYLSLSEAASEKPLRVPFTAVIELRDETDVADELARADAEAIYKFLAHRSVIAGEPGAIPPFTGIAAPLEATEIVKSPAAGIIVYRKALGEIVAAGEVVADVVDPLAGGNQCVPVKATTTGRLFVRAGERLAWPGKAIGKIQGREPLPGRIPGRLLYD
jgi:predicted deacylase